jgi:hypothetical protein
MELRMRSALRARSIAFSVLSVSLLWLSGACGSDATAPTSQTPLIPPGTAQAPLASADVAGSGGVSVTTKSIPEGYFDANISVHIVNARPSTTYIVQRAPEVGRALGSDGICQRALGLAPWSAADPAAPAFVTFFQPDGTTPFTVTTSAAGEGSVTFEFKVPTVPAGTKFDVMFRLINDMNAPTSVFQSSCFLVTVL